MADFVDKPVFKGGITISSAQSIECAGGSLLADKPGGGLTSLQLGGVTVSEPALTPWTSPYGPSIIISDAAGVGPATLYAQHLLGYGDVRVGTTGAAYFSTSTTMKAPSDGKLQIGNSDFDQGITLDTDTTADTVKVRNFADDADGDVEAGDARLSGGLRVASPSVPASASDTGTAGDIAWDSGYIYVCTATDTWVRVALSTWT